MKIAVLIASTSKNTDWVSVEDSLFVKRTIPSILSVASPDIEYKFFIGHDDDDQFFLKNDFSKVLESIDYEIVSVPNPIHKPCPVWNKLFEEAYSQGFEYFLQSGDDIEYTSPFDVEFISYLESIDNIGVIGGMAPYCPLIITQSFIHKTHMDIFGFLYPPELPDWSSDAWITFTYQKFKRSKISELHKIKNTRIAVPGADYQKNRYDVSPDHQGKLNQSRRLYNPVLQKYLDENG
jgi:hypothetical protein